DGVENKIDPGEPNLGNLYEKTLEEITGSGISILPQSLGESLSELEKDDVVQGGLGVIAEEFIKVKTSELHVSEQQVTAWEIDRYLTLF
ncbi:MAG: type III glutamate--ammonia ligase, partial [Planctomycetota bacterium]|nr:type III glutamate--ammonia ligase [Planctomycetota bacterium]